MSLWMLGNGIDRRVELFPKSCGQMFGDVTVFGSNLSGILRGSWMEDQIHELRRLSLSTAGLLEPFQSESFDLARVQFLTPAQHFVILYPMMGVFQASNQKCDELSPIRS
ncbi:MAG: hypothetical protein RL693_217 [Verrucomicrobiota bacterium]|jgi:hypothetical protein